MCDKYLGEFRGPSRIIFNGTDPNFYDKVLPVKVKQKNVFITFCRWRPHKRLRDTIDCFLLANIEDSILFVAGDLSRSRFSKSERSKYFSLPNVEYLGVLKQRELAPYLKAACASLHLCWVDWCPNSVVEAVVARTPVICGNVGGTQELVKPSGGYVCDTDKPYDLELIDLYSPPPINKESVAQAMRRCCQEKPKIDNSHVLIEKTARNYLEFMKKLINKRKGN